MTAVRSSDHDVRRLRCFLTVADTLQFRRAAARLAIAPAALTQHVNRLEADLGCRLFDRTSRYVRLTHDGRALLPLARDVVAANDRLDSVRRPAERPQQRMLRVGFSPTAPGCLMQPIFRELAIALGSRLTVRRFPEHEPADAVRRGEVDAAFVRGPVERNGLRTTVLFQEPRVAVMASDHHLAAAAELDLADLAEEVVAPMSCGAAEWIDHWIGGPRPGGGEPLLGQPVSGFDDMRQLCAIGRCIGICPASVGRLYPDPHVKYLRVAGLEPTRVLLCSRADADASELHLLRSVAQRVVAAACRPREVSGGCGSLRRGHVDSGPRTAIGTAA